MLQLFLLYFIDEELGNGDVKFLDEATELVIASWQRFKPSVSVYIVDLQWGRGPDCKGSCGHWKKSHCVYTLCSRKLGE
jgi:hypothetical protein